MSFLDDLDRGIDGEEFGREDRGIIGKSGSEDNVKALGGMEDRCRPFFVSVSVFRAVSVDEVVMWV